MQLEVYQECHMFWCGLGWYDNGKVAACGVLAISTLKMVMCRIKNALTRETLSKKKSIYLSLHKVPLQTVLRIDIEPSDSSP